MTAFVVIYLGVVPRVFRDVLRLTCARPLQYEHEQKIGGFHAVPVQAPSPQNWGKV